MHDLVTHLVGVNLVFAALLSDQAPPDRGTDHLGDNPAGAYRDSGVAVQAAVDQPGVLELPEDLAEQALALTRAQLSTMPRTGRFGPAQTVADDAPAIDQLVAFLGRPLSAGR